MTYKNSKWMTEDSIADVDLFIAQHPEITSIDLILFDINGIERGKRIPVSMLEKVVRHGVCMPASVFALDINGETVEETGLGFAQGDSDRVCRIVDGTLTVIPWKPGVAQAIITMLDQNQVDGFFSDPRQVLNKQLIEMANKNYFPCVAVEFEFYLQDLELDADGKPQPPLMPNSQQRMEKTQVYSLEELDEFREFIDEIIAACELQNIPAANITAEYAPGQFEVNLNHNLDVVQACDQAMAMKRVVREVAKKHGFKANFMAKPYREYSGSGCHVHISVFDENGMNVFNHTPEILNYSIAGILQYMPDTMAIIAPNANSYRRFQPNMFVSLWPNWGWDNRTVALRVPADTGQNRRLEHRISGADCNPYLVIAAILATMQEGIEQHMVPSEPISGNAYELEGSNFLPQSWLHAIDKFQSSDVLYQRLSAEFCNVYQQNKRSEQQSFFSQVSSLDYEWYL